MGAYNNNVKVKAQFLLFFLYKNEKSIPKQGT